MNIQQLEYLIAVDKYKHFGKAAQACFITQPTLSAMIQKFEDELDVKIFDRTTHPIRTTDVGIEIIKEAKQVIDSVNELKNKASLLNNVLAGTLNLGVIPTVSTYILPSEIFGFLKENPKILLNVKEMTTENIIRSIKSGELDAGIIATPFDAADEFYQDFLFNEELMLYSSEPMQDKQHAFVVPEEIDRDKVWLLEEGNCLRKQFENICHLKENNLKPHNLEFQASNIGTLVQLVDKIGGLTIVPELALEQFSKEQTEKVLHFRKPFPYREISLIYYKPTYKQKILDEMSGFIKKSLKNKLNFNKNPKEYINISPQ
ncbi:MAG: hydrogen peroxide-inducible genes activator [Bergeyella sp.]